MSRVGRLPITIPAGAIVTASADNIVSVKGPKGGLIKAVNKDMNIAVENNQIIVTGPNDRKEYRVLHGLTRASINNMIIGIEKGLEKSLELVGAGYRVQLQGEKLVANSECSHPVEIEPTEGVTFETPAATKVVVKSINKEKVGAVTTNIRSWRKPEPYRGKGIKCDNEVIRRKEGKAGKK